MAPPRGVHPHSPGPGQESVWDYPHPPELRANTRHLVVVLAGEVVAETDGGFRLVERAHAPVYFFPPDDVVHDALRATEYRTEYEHIGTASHFDVHGGGASASRSAWSYLTPAAAYAPLARHVAFLAGPMDVCEVDGERVVPAPIGLMGGWITSHVVGPFKGEPGSRRW